MNRGQTSRLQRLTAARQSAVDGDGARQIGSADARWASAQAFGRATIGLIFLFITPLLRVAARVYFRRLSGVGLDGLRPRGPVLLLANHPAAWTDALVLLVVLRRKVHFITYERLFHPWPPGWLPRMIGSLPLRFAS